MMLRFIYFVSLLLSLSLSEEEFLRPRKRHLRSCYKRGKNYRKRENYNNFDDKESMDLIDVASFIQNPDDTAFEGNQNSENRIAGLNYAREDSNSNVEDERDRTQDNQGINPDNVPEVNIYNNRRIPQYLNRKSQTTDEINNEAVFKTNEIKNADLFDSNINHRRNEKKSALRKMKIPFFSHDKASTSKTKKNKKRKLFTFYLTKNNSTKSSDRNSNNKEIKVKGQSLKINKRSNFEDLCPACKQRILFNSFDFLDNIRKTASGGIHNCRQFYQQKHVEEAPENNKQQNSNDLRNQDPNSDNKDVNDIFYSKKWRRNDELSIKKQRKLKSMKNKDNSLID